jgi:PKD repeat protein
MTATNALGSSTTSMTVVVIGLSDVNFTADSQSGTAPHQVEFTDTSTPGGTAWAWDFGDGQTGSGATATHTYTADGTYDVSLTVTYPSPVGAVTTTKDDFITVAVATCTVPELNNVRFNDAQAIWNAAKFTGTVIRDTGAPQGNFLIKTQSLVYPDPAPCTSDVRVSAP